MLAIIYTTINSKKRAKKIAKALLKKKLVGCIQMSKVTSMYCWKKELCVDDEILLIMKTKTKNYRIIEKNIKKYHHYEIPEIYMQTKNIASKSYWKWLQRSLKK